MRRPGSQMRRLDQKDSDQKDSDQKNMDQENMDQKRCLHQDCEPTGPITP